MLLYKFLSSRAHTKTFLLFGIFLSAAAGAVFAKDVPDLVFRYLLLGTNSALIFGLLVASLANKEKVEKKGSVVDVEIGDEKFGAQKKMPTMEC